MKLYKSLRNGWFHPASLQRLFFHITQSISNNSWLGISKCKYTTIRIDMRTGSFLVMDSNGDILNDLEIEKLFKSETGMTDCKVVSDYELRKAEKEDD